MQRADLRLAGDTGDGERQDGRENSAYGVSESGPNYSACHRPAASDVNRAHDADGSGSSAGACGGATLEIPSAVTSALCARGYPVRSVWGRSGGTHEVPVSASPSRLEAPARGEGLRTLGVCCRELQLQQQYAHARGVAGWTGRGVSCAALRTRHRAMSAPHAQISSTKERATRIALGPQASTAPVRHGGAYICLQSGVWTRAGNRAAQRPASFS